MGTAMFPQMSVGWRFAKDDRSALFPWLEVTLKQRRRIWEVAFQPHMCFSGLRQGAVVRGWCGAGSDNVPQPTGQGWAQLGFCGRQVALLFTFPFPFQSPLLPFETHQLVTAEKEKPKNSFHHISAQLGLCDWQVVFFLHLQRQITGLSSFLNPIVLGHSLIE